MRRIISTLLATVALTGALVALTGTPAAAYEQVRGCSLSQGYSSATSNGLVWSYSDQNAYHTPTARAGSCGHVYVISLGVNNAPACFYARIRTYNEDRTVRNNGPWYRFEGIGRLGDLVGEMGGIANMRLYRVYVYGCEPFRDPRYTPGLLIYTHG